MCRMTRALARDDDDAAVATSMYKAVNKAAPSKADNEYYLFGDKGTVCSYAPRGDVTAGRLLPRQAPATVRLGGGLFQL